jgi:hypothetical protein
VAGFVVRLPIRLPIRSAVGPRGPGHQGVERPADLRPVALHHLRVDAQKRVGLLVANLVHEPRDRRRRLGLEPQRAGRAGRRTGGGVDAVANRRLGIAARQLCGGVGGGGVTTTWLVVVAWPVRYTWYAASADRSQPPRLESHR